MVNVETCRTKHRILNGGIALLLSLMGLMTAGAVWAVSAGYRAEKQSTDVQGELDVHEAAQNEREQHTQATLERIENSVDATQDMVAELAKER